MRNWVFDHVHLTSRDPMKTAEFYEQMFGAKKVTSLKTLDGRTIVALNLNGSAIEVMQPRAQPLVLSAPATGLGLEHFGLRTDSLEAMVSDLKQQGVKFLEGITVRPRAKFTFLLGPENVLIELLQRDEH